MSNTDGGLWPDEPVPAGVQPGPRAGPDEALSVVEGLGFRRHAEVKVPFDPYLHDAVGMDSQADAEPGTVVEVVSPGYGEGDRQRRPAAVVLAGKRG